MSISQNKLSDQPYLAPYYTPDGTARLVTNDWERGPIAITDTSGGMDNQDWKLEFAAGQFTITPQTVGLPSVILTGNEPIDSVQCTFCFDQNARPTIAWVDSTGAGNLYWYDTLFGDFQTLVFDDPVTSVALCLDDKRAKQVGANDMLLWYTLPTIVAGEYDLYHRLQRDRFLTAYPMKSATYPYIKKCGMNHGLRVQITLGTVNSLI